LSQENTFIEITIVTQHEAKRST